jgi:hypothetical protein
MRRMTEHNLPIAKAWTLELPGAFCFGRATTN